MVLPFNCSVCILFPNQKVNNSKLQHIVAKFSNPWAEIKNKQYKKDWISQNFPHKMYF